jgi:hypothetical protein
MRACVSVCVLYAYMYVWGVPGIIRLHGDLFEDSNINQQRNVAQPFVKFVDSDCKLAMSS